MTISVALITMNEEEKLGTTLSSVRWADEIVVVDSGSTDKTLEIARSFGAKIFSEPWKGFAGQKNSSIEKATGDWILSLDADESVEPELAEEIQTLMQRNPAVSGYYIARKNIIFGRWIRHGGWYPDYKLRLFRKGTARFIERPVHESMAADGKTENLRYSLVHDAYHTIERYIEANNRYTSLGAGIVYKKTGGRFDVLQLLVNPFLTFIKNYFFRLGFLDGKQGLILHVNHSVQIFWKYAKAWELGQKRRQS